MLQALALLLLPLLVSAEWKFNTTGATANGGTFTVTIAHSGLAAVSAEQDMYLLGVHVRASEEQPIADLKVAQDNSSMLISFDMTECTESTTASAGGVTTTGAGGATTTGAGATTTGAPATDTTNTVSAGRTLAVPTCLTMAGLASMGASASRSSSSSIALMAAIGCGAGAAGVMATEFCPSGAIVVKYGSDLCLISHSVDGPNATFTFKKDCPATDAPTPAPPDEMDSILSTISCMNTCWNNWEDTDCLKCIDTEAATAGFSQLPVSYTLDMLKFKLGTGYTAGWCGTNPNHPNEGVDISQYPSGWKPDGNGSWTGCEVKTDFPGLHQTSHMSNAYIKAQLPLIPGQQDRDEIWRGNELGFIISNELFWPEQISPRGVLLGANKAQHKVTRPVLDRLYSNCDAACYKKIEYRAMDFMLKESVRVQEDLIIFVHEVLWDITFPGENNPIDMEEFIKTQSSFTALSTITQLVPDTVTNYVGKKALANLKKYYDWMKPLVTKHFANDIVAKDCSPSLTCADQLTAAILDTFMAAGGLSVPSALATGLWIMYGDTQNAAYNGMFADVEKFRVDNNDPVPFFYESMRFFAPVVGFPMWTTFPERATNEEGSQAEGGVRKILNLALGNKDPNAFGGDAHKFRVRPLSEYHDNFVGFADFAIDNSVAGGKMNRVCPGKDLAIKIGKAFFSQWDFDEWQASEKTGYTEAVPFVGAFELTKPSYKSFWSQIWDDLISKGYLLITTDWRFDQYTRGLSALNSYEVLAWTYPKAADVSPPKEHSADFKVKCGLAHEILVPKDDESYPEVSHTGAYVSSKYAQLLPFPHDAGDVGDWRDDEEGREEEILKDLLFSGLNNKRILVPWQDSHKYTDAGLEDLIWRGIGQHRIQKVKANDAHKGNAAFAVYLDFAEGLETKPGLDKLGAIAYFSQDQKITHIHRLGKTYSPSEEGWKAYTTAAFSSAQCSEVSGQRQCTREWSWKNWWWNKVCTCDVPYKVGWKHAKMAFLGTLSAVITAIDHLYSLHLVVSNAIVTANVEQLNHTHALRQLMTPFSFRTAAINYKSAVALVNERGLIHRAMPLTVNGLRALYTYARDQSAGITWATIPQRHAAQNLGVQLYLHEDGGDFYKVVHNFVHTFLTAHYDYASNACATDPQLVAWHKEVNMIAPSNDLPADITCEHIEDLLSTFIYLVTGAHTHVGSMVAEVEDPCHMPWSWKEGDFCGTPRTAFVQLLTFALTSLEQPKLLDDYTHMFPEEADKQIWRDFQTNLTAFGQRVNDRNTKRARPFKSYDVEYMEVSIGI